MSCTDEEVLTYDFGDDVYCEGRFYNTAGALADPTAVFAKTTNPQGVVVDYEYGVDIVLTKPSTGVYHLKVDADTPGTWKYRIYSTGVGKAAVKGSFIVDSEW